MSRLEPHPTGWRAFPLRTCRICGCDDLHACPGRCWWVAPDLCSSCEAAARAIADGEVEDAGPLLALLVALSAIATLAGLVGGLAFFALNAPHFMGGGHG